MKILQQLLLVPPTIYKLHFCLFYEITILTLINKIKQLHKYNKHETRENKTTCSERTSKQMFTRL